MSLNSLPIKEEIGVINPPIQLSNKTNLTHPIPFPPIPNAYGSQNIPVLPIQTVPTVVPVAPFLHEIQPIPNNFPDPLRIGHHQILPIQGVSHIPPLAHQEYNLDPIPNIHSVPLLKDAYVVPEDPFARLEPHLPPLNALPPGTSLPLKELINIEIF